MSFPAMSDITNGPTAMPKRFGPSAASTSDTPSPASPPPWSTRSSADSVVYGCSIRFPTNPSQFPTTTGTFPIRLATARTTSSASGDVSLPRTTSTSLMTCAGLKKCIPAQRPRRPGDSDDAMASTSSVEVLLRSSASSFRTIASSWEKMSLFTPRFSNAASTTRSQSARPERAADDRRRDSVAFNFDAGRRPFSTSPRRTDRMYRTPASSPLGFTSTRVTGPNPARRKEIAMPRPMVPAPMTPTAPLPLASWFPAAFFLPPDEEEDARSAKNM
mmetsp:Transcript_57639/g.122283  ORF Transcript_57639/g.122283 Transcript_57639/m.122283 type:complete len:274 (-) Transcript_57639:947-1768(-)